LGSLFFFGGAGESNDLNAVRMSAAGEGLTEPLCDLIDSPRHW